MFSVYYRLIGSVCVYLPYSINRIVKSKSTQSRKDFAMKKPGADRPRLFHEFPLDFDRPDTAEQRQPQLLKQIFIVAALLI